LAILVIAVKESQDLLIEEAEMLMPTRADAKERKSLFLFHKSVSRLKRPSLSYGSSS
jgi:hypothetical protein